jgi:hypothetical protein
MLDSRPLIPEAIQKLLRLICHTRGVLFPFVRSRDYRRREKP